VPWTIGGLRGSLDWAILPDNNRPTSTLLECAAYIVRDGGGQHGRSEHNGILWCFGNGCRSRPCVQRGFGALRRADLGCR
jgi:hypothetical protein